MARNVSLQYTDGGRRAQLFGLARDERNLGSAIDAMARQCPEGFVLLRCSGRRDRKGRRWHLFAVFVRREDLRLGGPRRPS